MRYDQKYKNYSAQRLLLENYLRPVPLRLKELMVYAGHAYDTLKVAKSALKREGRLLNNATIPDHPENIAMSLEPLEDMRILPKPYTKVNEAHAKKAREHAAEALGAAANTARIARLSESEVKDILSTYIKNGANGKDFIAAVNAYLAFTSTKEPLGLPAPLSDDELTTRLAQLLAPISPSIISDALELADTLRSAAALEPALPRESALDQDDVLDSEPATDEI